MTAPIATAPTSGTLRRRGLGYEYEPINERTNEPSGLIFKVGLVSRVGGKLKGSVQVRTASGKHVFSGPVEFGDTWQREKLWKYLASSARAKGIDGPWPDYVEGFCTLVDAAESRGSPIVTPDYKRREQSPRQPDLLDRLLPRGKVTTWFGGPGAGKGWLVTAAIVAIAHGSDLAGMETDGDPHEILVLDWEDSPETFAERLVAVANGYGIPPDDRRPIRYRQMYGSLARDIEAIADFVKEHKVDLVVVDSMGMAAGEDAGMGAAGIQVFFEALRLLYPCTILIVDHVRARTQEEQDANLTAGKAIGSQYKMAEVRAGWEITKEQEPESNKQLIGFTHAKFNHTKRFRPFSVELTFEGPENGAPDAVLFRRAEIADTETLSRLLTLPDRIHHSISHRPLTVAEIAESLGMADKKGEDKVRNALNRGRGKRFIQTQEGAWGLLDRPMAQSMVRSIAEHASEGLPW